jgi:hypothetical protein
MKNILKLLSITLILAFATSCNVDQVGPKYLNGNRGVSFDNAKYTAEVERTGTFIDIHVARVSAVLEETVGLTNNCTDVNLFTIPQTVIFAKGEYEKMLRIAVVAEDMVPGKTYSFNLTLEEIASLSGVTSTAVSVGLKLEWVAAGTADIDSDWAGEFATIPVERAVGTDIYRLVSPYWYLEPDYCPDQGYHVMFEVDANYDAVYLYPSNIGEVASNGSWFLVCNGYEAYGCSFTNTGNVYIIDGLWGRGPNSDNLTLAYYAYEVFEWHR